MDKFGNSFFFFPKLQKHLFPVQKNQPQKTNSCADFISLFLFYMLWIVFWQLQLTLADKTSNMTKMLFSQKCFCTSRNFILRFSCLLMKHKRNCLILVVITSFGPKTQLDLFFTFKEVGQTIRGVTCQTPQPPSETIAHREHFTGIFSCAN